MRREENAGKKTKKKKKIVFNKKFFSLFSQNRVVSNVHAVISTVLSFIALCTSRSFFDGNVIGSFTVLMTSSYLFFDFIQIVVYHEALWDRMTVLHHVCGFLGFSYAMRTLQLQNIVLMFVFTEITTPFVNARWFLYKLHMQDSLLYILNGGIMLLGFLVFRIGMNPLTAYFVYQNAAIFFSANDPILYFTVVTLWGAEIIFNSYWTYLIAKGFFKALFGGQKKSASASKENGAKKPESIALSGKAKKAD